MNQPQLHGSATILQFPIRPAGPSAVRANPAEIAYLNVNVPEPVPFEAWPVVDAGAWYHAEAMLDAQNAGKH